ncbi:hypothetical protein C2E23DRAFT_834748 [Lenzites betulinus]|nr:hypothetical protein C2E23DRAFT_834748 [Lenzites betulinus]
MPRCHRRVQTVAAEPGTRTCRSASLTPTARRSRTSEKRSRASCRTSPMAQRSRARGLLDRGPRCDARRTSNAISISVHGARTAGALADCARRVGEGGGLPALLVSADCLRCPRPLRMPAQVRQLVSGASYSGRPLAHLAARKSDPAPSPVGGADCLAPSPNLCGTPPEIRARSLAPTRRGLCASDECSASKWPSVALTCVGCFLVSISYEVRWSAVDGPRMGENLRMRAPRK